MQENKKFVIYSWLLKKAYIYRQTIITSQQGKFILTPSHFRAFVAEFRQMFLHAIRETARIQFILEVEYMHG